MAALTFEYLSHLAKFFVALFEQGIDRFVPQLIEMRQKCRAQILRRRLMILVCAAKRFGNYFIDQFQLFEVSGGQLQSFCRFRRVAAMLDDFGYDVHGLAWRADGRR